MSRPGGPQQFITALPASDPDEKVVATGGRGTSPAARFTRILAATERKFTLQFGVLHGP